MNGGTFIRNKIGGRPTHNPQVLGDSAQEASSVYDDFYGQMPVPATQFATSVTALSSLETVPSVRTAMANASVVSRHNRRNGIKNNAGYQIREAETPQIPRNVNSSRFQEWLVGDQVAFSLNDDWYIAYPAASVMLGGLRNLALSTRVAQLPTRTTGGPGPASMRPRPRFSRVQTIPRYSTMPPQYPTQSTQE